VKHRHIHTRAQTIQWFWPTNTLTTKPTQQNKKTEKLNKTKKKGKRTSHLIKIHFLARRERQRLRGLRSGIKTKKTQKVVTGTGTGTGT
jgi:hypothetical protein